MKNPTFLVELVNELNDMCYFNNISVKFTVDTFDSRELTRAFNIVQDDKFRLEDELAEIRVNSDCYDPADYNELMQSIDINNKLFTDLVLLQELGKGEDEGMKSVYDCFDVDYASPQNLPKSIRLISGVLANQLEGKAEGTPFYDEYCFKLLTNVLEELCNIIKEA